MILALVALAAAGELAGTLLGEEGDSIVGATVVAYDPRFNYATATSRSGGAWTITGLPANPYRIVYYPGNDDPHADGFFGGAASVCDIERIEVTEEGERTGLDDVLPVGGTLSGRVLDLAGNPVPGAVVEARGNDSATQVVTRSATTGSDGRYEIVGLDAAPGGSPYEVIFGAEGWPGQWLGQSYSSSNAENAWAVLGEPTDLGDYALLDGISVSGLVTGPDGPVASGTAYVYSNGQVLAPTIDASGVYLAEGLPPGDVVAWASSPGLATTYYPGSDRPGSAMPVHEEGVEATLDLDLPVESTFTLVFSGDGDVGEVSVLVYNDTYTVGRGDGADDDGRVTITGLYPADYYVYVFADTAGLVSGFAMDGADRRLFAVDGDTEVEIELRQAASFSGTVTGDDGEPVYGATVSAIEVGADDPRTWDTTTDHDGRYTLTGLDSVAVRLVASSWWYCPSDPGWADTWYDGARAEEGALLLEPAEGEARDGVDLVMPVDDDHDDMGDSWEREHGLDPGRDDSDDDLDGDGYTNLEEWLMDTDPSGGADVGEACGGCNGAPGAGGVATATLLAAATRRRRGAPSR